MYVFRARAKKLRRACAAGIRLPPKGGAERKKGVLKTRADGGGACPAYEVRCRSPPEGRRKAPDAQRSLRPVSHRAKHARQLQSKWLLRLSSLNAGDHPGLRRAKTSTAWRHASQRKNARSRKHARQPWAGLPAYSEGSSSTGSVSRNSPRSIQPLRVSAISSDSE